MKLTKENLRAIIYYCFKRKLTVGECFKEMSNSLGEDTISKSTIYFWFSEFRRKRKSLKDEPHHGRPLDVTTYVNVTLAKKLIKENPRITYTEIQNQLEISAYSVHKILRNNLKVKKVFSRWVPHALTEEQRKVRKEICQKNLNTFEQGGPQFISKIVTGDETYVPFYDAPTHQETKLWVFENEDVPTVLHYPTSRKKLMFTVFFRSTGLVKAVAHKEQKTVTAKSYTEITLPQVLKELNIKGLLLHHDNASSHTAIITKNFIKKNKLKLLEHPPYSPDLAPCDFWLFPKLKRHLRGFKFESEEEIIQEVISFLEAIKREEYFDVFKMWKDRMKRCIEFEGDYFEGI